MRVLIWHRNDLRLRDNPLYANLSPGDQVLPVYVFDTGLMKVNSYGFCRLGPYRADFLVETLENLQQKLLNKGAKLHLFAGRPHEILKELVIQLHIDEVWATKEHTSFEADDEKKVAAAISPNKLRLFEDRTLIHPDRLPFAIGHLPDVFTEFRKKVEGYSSIVPELPEPTQLKAIEVQQLLNGLMSLRELGILPVKNDPRAAFCFKGGEEEALKRLQKYFFEDHHVATYKETRNGLLGANYSTRFSPWLANGSLSPRTIYHALKKYEKTHGSSQNTYWVYFELLWRDYCHFVALKYGNRIFKPGGIKSNDNTCYRNEAIFEKWKTGNTGNDFVDANMRELMHTGWMSNRGRQNVASYLVKDLKLCWLDGAAWFESQLIDYDVCSNYVNWMYIAGVGNDPRENRYFNTRKQAEMYDPQGAYRSLWLK